jgi:CDI immunity proteins
MVARCLALRRKPLSMLGRGDLSFLLGQRIGQGYLIPKALELLPDEPLQEADLYRGDLLSSSLHVDRAFWADHPTTLPDLIKTSSPTAQPTGSTHAGTAGPSNVAAVKSAPLRKIERASATAAHEQEDDAAQQRGHCDGAEEGTCGSMDGVRDFQPQLVVGQARRHVGRAMVLLMSILEPVGRVFKA